MVAFGYDFSGGRTVDIPEDQKSVISKLDGNCEFIRVEEAKTQQFPGLAAVVEQVAVEEHKKRRGRPKINV